MKCPRCGGTLVTDPLEQAEYWCPLCSRRFDRLLGELLPQRRPPTAEEAARRRGWRK